jgi:hypothetical protein
MLVKQTYYLTREQVVVLKDIAYKKGYIVKRGPYTGEGCVSKLLQALADGQLAAIKLGGE